MGVKMGTNEFLCIHGSLIRHIPTCGNNAHSYCTDWGIHPARNFNPRQHLKLLTVKSSHASFCLQTGIGEFQRYLYYGHSCIICEPGTVRVTQQGIKHVVFNHMGITCNICGLIYVYLSADRIDTWCGMTNRSNFLVWTLFIFMHYTYIINIITKCYHVLVCKERAKIDHACCTILFRFEIKYCFNKRMNTGRNVGQEVLQGMGNLSGLGVGKFGNLTLWM